MNGDGKADHPQLFGFDYIYTSLDEIELLSELIGIYHPEINRPVHY